MPATALATTIFESSPRSNLVRMNRGFVLAAALAVTMAGIDRQDR